MRGRVLIHILIWAVVAAAVLLQGPRGHDSPAIAVAALTLGAAASILAVTWGRKARRSRVPPGWGEDSISGFIETARGNTLGTFHTQKEFYKGFLALDQLYRDAISTLPSTLDAYPRFFLVRSHVAYLGALRLALSGQPVETYMVLRGCLEASLYGLHVAQDADRFETWLRRSDGAKHRNSCRSEFSYGNVMQTLKSVDPKTHKVAQKLYDFMIDWGGHPNDASILGLLSMEEKKDGYTFRLKYLTDLGDQQFLAMKTAARVGVCALYVLRNAFREDFDRLGFTDTLSRLSEHL